jgi:hypothetical protein
VKAKSFNPQDENIFITKMALVSGWKPYLFDLAFQNTWHRKPFLNSSLRPIYGRQNKKQVLTEQMFRIPKNGNPRTDIIKKSTFFEGDWQFVLSERMWMILSMASPTNINTTKRLILRNQ